MIKQVWKFEITPKQTTLEMPKGAQPSWWGFTSDEVLDNTELERFKYVLFEADEVEDAMDWFIGQFGVESMAGEVDDVDWFMQQFGVESMSGDAPMQAEGGQL